MNLSKSSEFFNPSMIQHSIHIIGCGAVGSTLAENLVRLGLTRFTLWDFDQVESKNIVNQMFFSDQIGTKTSLKPRGATKFEITTS